MSNEYTDLLGTKFTPHGRSKEQGFDCYGLAIEVLRRNGIKLKDVFYEDIKDETKGKIRQELHSSINNIKLDKPQKNCIIEFKEKGLPLHIGVYIGNGQFIHATRQGVVICNLERYKTKIMGYYKVLDS